MNKKLFVLIIEDSEEDAEQNVRYLQNAGYDIHYQRVETANEMKSALEKQKWDVILADYLMPRFSVPAALEIYKESESDIPFIVISGAIGDKKAVGMMKTGVHDYFLKDNMTRFIAAVERELREAATRKEKRRAHQNLQIQHEMSLKLNKTTDLKVALNYVIETIHKIEGIDFSSIYIYNSQKGALELSAYHGLSQDVLKLTSQFDAGSPFYRFVREGHPIYGQYNVIRQQIDDVPDNEWFLTSAIIPIEVDAQSIGAIFCASGASDDFLSGTKITLESIASQIGGTIARIKSEMALQKSERELKAIMNSSTEPIFLIDFKGTILTSNEGLGIRLGMEEKKLSGKNIYDLLPPEVAKYRKLKIETVFKSGEPIRFEDERSGRTILTSVYPVSDTDGKITRAAIFGLDITDRILAEKRLIHSERMAGLGELAAGIAHEINQPLNTISLIMDNLLSEFAKDENIEEGYLKNKSDKIFENITRMRNIIDHIRAFSRNQDVSIIAGFDINSSIRNAVSMISEQFKHLAIHLNLDLEEKLPEIRGNTYKVEEVILNLLVNAKDALLEKRHKVTESRSHKVDENFEMVVGIRSFQEDHSIIVEINDNGIGIRDEDIGRIMLPFYTTKDVGKGTGLGLSISYQIIREMHGTIEISSNIRKGTTIRITLGIN